MDFWLPKDTNMNNPMEIHNSDQLENKMYTNDQRTRLEKKTAHNRNPERSCQCSKDKNNRLPIIFQNKMYDIAEESSYICEQISNYKDVEATNNLKDRIILRCSPRVQRHIVNKENYRECDTNNIDSYVYPPVEQFTSDTSYNKKEFSSVKHSNGSLDQFSLKRQDFIKQIPLLPSIVHEQKFSKSYPEEIFRRQRSIKCKHLHKTFKNCLWTLFYTNASLLVLGLILLILALSHFLAKKYISIVTEETGFVIWLWVILILSALIVIVGVYGIITSINPNKCRIVSYCMETFILAFMIIIFLVFLRILFVNIKGVQHSLMSNTLKKYRCIKHIRNAWNELQENFKCCGIEGKEDWKYAPSSCCNATSQQGKMDCIKHFISKEQAFNHGCKSKLENYFTILLVIAAGLLLVILLLLILDIIISLWLIKNYERIINCREVYYVLKGNPSREIKRGKS